MPFLEVSTGVKCGMACSYCPRDKIAKSYRGPSLMSLETFNTALANTPDNLPVSFAGYAEPYLNVNCSAMVQAAADVGRRVQMYTTGVGMNVADVEMLESVKPSPMILHLPDAGGDMKAKVTPEYAERMQRLAANVPGLRTVCYGEWHPMLMDLKRYEVGYGLHSRAGNVTHLAQVKRHGPLRCRPAPNLDENVLLPSGELSLCCNDWGLVHIVGDLTRRAWADIHAGEAMAAHREKMRSGESCLCSTCEFAEAVWPNLKHEWS